MSRLPLYDVADLSLAPEGKLKIEWSEQQMPVCSLIRRRFYKEKPLKGVVVSACLHVTSETANLLLALEAGGARVACCASNPLSTQDKVAASLVKSYKISVFAKRGESSRIYYKHLSQVLDFFPQVTLDDGGDLISELHKNRKNQLRDIIGSCEETTTGVIRLRAMEKSGALKLPVMAVNDSCTKRFFDNRYGTGQSSIDGILRATNILLAGKSFVVVGYGWCGRGVAMRAAGMGAKVIICEVDSIKALEAVMDGFQVLPMSKAVGVGDIFLTTTGNKRVISLEHIKMMKDGVILANSGHFNVEVDVVGLEEAARKRRKLRDDLVEYWVGRKKVYLLAEGRLVNLAAGEGHPAEVMDMSFANQCLAAEYFVKNKGKLKPKVYVLPEDLDKRVARMKLRAMGVLIDKLTLEQKKYLTSWEEGT